MGRQKIIAVYTKLHPGYTLKSWGREEKTAFIGCVSQGRLTDVPHNPRSKRIDYTVGGCWTSPASIGSSLFI